jgi:hypothetical protein
MPRQGLRVGRAARYDPSDAPSRQGCSPELSIGQQPRASSVVKPFGQTARGGWPPGDY